MSKRWPNGSSAAWRRVRRQVLERDGYVCQVRLDGCTSHATHVHHVGAREVTGDDPAYLVATCQWCNLSTGDPTKLNPEVERPEWLA